MTMHRGNPFLSVRLADVVLILLVCVLVGVTLLTGSQSRQKWEYTVQGSRDAQVIQDMNLLGMQGWEAVSARRTSDTENGVNITGYEVLYKRPATGLGDRLRALGTNLPK